jgi:hypothetical protein
MTQAAAIAQHHVWLFNQCVQTADFTLLLAEFSSDAQVRFENVPGAGLLEFHGLPAITAAYQQQPPDDQIVVTAEPFTEDDTIVVPFAWRTDNSPGTMRLTYTAGQLDRMVVVFG